MCYLDLAKRKYTEPLETYCSSLGINGLHYLVANAAFKQQQFFGMDANQAF